MDKKLNTDEYLETLDTSSEYPSDADVEEAKNLKSEVSEKHRKTKRTLDERLRQHSKDETSTKLQEEKKRLSQSLGATNDDDEQASKEKRRTERRKKRRDSEKPEDKTKEKGRSGRKKKDKETADNIPDETEDIQEETEIERVNTPGTMEASNTITRAKKVDRAGIAAAMRERRKREKDTELLSKSQKEGEISEHSLIKSSIDKSLTRFDIEQKVEDSSLSIETIPIVETMTSIKLESTRYKSTIVESEISWESLKQQETITDKQAFDFFCKQWPDHPPRTEKSETTTSPADDNVERRPSGDLDDSLRLIEKQRENLDFGLMKGPHVFLDKWPAKNIPTSYYISKEEEIGYLYIPGDVDRTLLQDRGFRNIEDEGLYVGRRPQINLVNERRLESRIQMEKSFDWFGEDGRIKILPDPLKEIPFRPMMYNEQINPIPENLRTENYKAIITTNNYEQIDSGDINHSFKMIINIDCVEFCHHHLYTLEHVYAQRLKELFIAYRYIDHQESLPFFEQRILSLKHAIEHLAERIRVHEINDNKQGILETIEGITKYRQEIRDTRMARNNEESYLRRLKTSIIKTWKQIKKERVTTGMTLTSVVVKIKSVLADEVEDKRVIQNDIDEEVQEEKLYFEESYKQSLQEYEDAKMKYDKQYKLKTAAKSRQEEKARREMEGQIKEGDIDETNLYQQKKDFEILAEPELVEPELPTPFDEESVRDNIRIAIEKNRRLPGEPHIHPKLKVGSITSEDLTREETSRRYLMNQYQYYAELFFNNKKVISTGYKQLGIDFVVRFGESIPTIISQYPELIVFKLYEKVGFSSRLMANVELNVPPPHKVSETDNLELYTFKTDQILVHKMNNSVGSGEKEFSLESIDGTPSGELISPLFTAGLLYARTLWAEDSNGDIMMPESYLNSEKYKRQQKNRDPLMALGLSEILELQRRQEWKAIESHLDPNDPRDAKVIKALHTNEQFGIDPGTKMSSDYFRLNPYMDEFDLATDEDMNRSLRFKMIHLRNTNVPEFRNLTIPLYDDKVPLELIKDYENRKSSAKKKVTVTGFEARKLIHAEFIEKVREEVLMKFKTALMQKSLPEMVREEEIPTVSDIFPKLLNLNRFNRPLQRKPESRKPIPVHSIYDMDVEIVIVIQRATNLPVDNERKTITPFVQISFQGYSKVTDVLEGPNPAWDMELRLPFKPPTAITSLDTIKDSVLINLYDQQVIDMTDKTLAKGTVIHERYERHWLGCLEIPFNTIYLNSKIEGNFQLKRPPFVQGYDSNKVMNVSAQTMLSLFITMDPEIRPPLPLKERFDSMEDKDLLYHVDKWHDSLVFSFPGRFRRPTVLNMRCQETIITRFISPLAPPPKFLVVEEDKKTKVLARYVSFIPFMADALVFPGISDIWSTCDQFLKMLIGDEEEHAVLLCNYFLYLYGDPNKVYLCLGDAIPEGSTCYVLTIENDDTKWLWNSSTGTRYITSDPTCSMFSVGMLVNPKNVWANIQQRYEPWEIRYDINVKTDWSPLFKNDVILNTVQPEAILYEDPYLKEVQDYQFTLENQLRSSIMDWRMGLQTNFLIAPRREMIEVLKNLEISCGEMTDEIQHLMKNITKGYKVFGFPLHLPYMEITDILARVEATGIHQTAAPGVEFAVAVYIEAYPNTVLSIWIYVASMMRER